MCSCHQEPPLKATLPVAVLSRSAAALLAPVAITQFNYRTLVVGTKIFPTRSFLQNGAVFRAEHWMLTISNLGKIEASDQSGLSVGASSLCLICRSSP